MKYNEAELWADYWYDYDLEKNRRKIYGNRMTVWQKFKGLFK